MRCGTSVCGPTHAKRACILGKGGTKRHATSCICEKVRATAMAYCPSKTGYDSISHSCRIGPVLPRYYGRSIRRGQRLLRTGQ